MTTVPDTEMQDIRDLSEKEMLMVVYNEIERLHQRMDNVEVLAANFQKAVEEFMGNKTVKAMARNFGVDL